MDALKKSAIVESTANEAGESTANEADPFDLSKLRLSQSFVELAGAKKLLTTVPVRKPLKQDFVRVHPDATFRDPFALKQDFVRVQMKMLYTTINRQGVVFLWPVPLPAADGRFNEWHRSAQEAAERAMHRWIRIKANMALGANEVFEAPGSIPDPEWPGHSFQELLRIGFRDKLIENLDHPVLKRLRGEC